MIDDKTIAIREKIHRLRQLQPFQSFNLILESGVQVKVEHSENLGYSRTTKEGRRGWDEFCLYYCKSKIFSTFSNASAMFRADDG